MFCLVFHVPIENFSIICRSLPLGFWNINLCTFKSNNDQTYLVFKVALGVCFALKSWKEYLLLFTYLITLGKDVNFPLITKNKQASELFISKSNTELKCGLTD